MLNFGRKRQRTAEVTEAALVTDLSGKASAQFAAAALDAVDSLARTEGVAPEEGRPLLDSQARSAISAEVVRCLADAMIRRQKRPRPVHLSDVLDVAELAVRIFVLLPLKHRLACASVCRAWASRVRHDCECEDRHDSKTVRCTLLHSMSSPVIQLGLFSRSSKAFVLALSKRCEVKKFLCDDSGNPVQSSSWNVVAVDADGQWQTFWDRGGKRNAVAKADAGPSAGGAGAGLAGGAPAQGIPIPPVPQPAANGVANGAPGAQGQVAPGAQGEVAPGAQGQVAPGAQGQVAPGALVLPAGAAHPGGAGGHAVGAPLVAGAVPVMAAVNGVEGAQNAQWAVPGVVTVGGGWASAGASQGGGSNGESVRAHGKAESDARTCALWDPRSVRQPHDPQVVVNNAGSYFMLLQNGSVRLYYALFHRDWTPDQIALSFTLPPHVTALQFFPLDNNVFAVAHSAQPDQPGLPAVHTIQVFTVRGATIQALSGYHQRPIENIWYYKGTHGSFTFQVTHSADIIHWWRLSHDPQRPGMVHQVPTRSLALPPGADEAIAVRLHPAGDAVLMACRRELRMRSFCDTIPNARREMRCVTAAALLCSERDGIVLVAGSVQTPRSDQVLFFSCSGLHLLKKCALEHGKGLFTNITAVIPPEVPETRTMKKRQNSIHELAIGNDRGEVILLRYA